MPAQAAVIPYRLVRACLKTLGKNIFPVGMQAMALYEKRTYSVTVGRMGDVVHLYTEIGWPVLRPPVVRNISSAIFSATPGR